VTAMFAGGLIAETSALIAKYGDAVSTLNALGYKQALLLLRGEIDEAEAIRQTQQGHRNYAKRQMSWFRREAGVNWFRGFGDERAIADQAIAVVDEAIETRR
jgi:tRNA dimethylallyltransferase